MTAVSTSVLIVDDDDALRTSLRMALEDHGYRVEEAADGETAVLQLQQHSPDVVVLDLELPGMDGLECCWQLRSAADVPILIMSARGGRHDLVAGLEVGADDYIRKPFDVPELTARLRALRRSVRPPAEAASGVALGDLMIRSDRGEVSVAGQQVLLTKTEFRLLAEMASAPGRVFTRELLLERVWDYDYFADARIVDVHVSRLRAKIETDPIQPRRLVTVHGLGYKLEAGRPSCASPGSGFGPSA